MTVELNSPAEKQHLALLWQDSGLFLGLTVSEVPKVMLFDQVKG